MEPWQPWPSHSSPTCCPRADEYTRLVTPAVVSIINVFIPYAIKPLTFLEFYKNPQTVFYLNIARTLVARVAICGTYLGGVFNSSVYFWNEIGFTGCWENALGQVAYQLIMFEAALNLLFTLSAFATYHLLRCTRWKTKWEFSTSLGILELIYRQGLVFVGQFFCPLLAVVQAIHLLLLFYLDFVYLRVTCRPLRKVFRLGNGSSAFLKVSAAVLGAPGPPPFSGLAHLPPDQGVAASLQLLRGCPGVEFHRRPLMPVT